MNCDEYKEFHQREAARLPGLIPPHQHPVCQDIAMLEEERIMPIALKEPSPLELVSNFSTAMTVWVKAGAPVVSEEVYRERAAICDGCEYWQPEARLGLGKCSAPGCGCTKLKRWLATESCPLRKWNVASSP